LGEATSGKDAAHGRRFRGRKKKAERPRENNLSGAGWAAWRTGEQGRQENRLKGCEGLLQKGWK